MGQLDQKLREICLGPSIFGKNLKYFLSLETRNYTNKLIYTVENNGNIIKDQTKISEEIIHAEKLNQNDPNYLDSLDNFLLNNGMPKLTSEQKKLVTSLSMNQKF